MNSLANDRDQWSRWLEHRRTYGDGATRDKRWTRVRRVRDKVLDRAALRPGDFVLDVGAGDGLIAFGVLERVPESRVILCDASRSVLSDALSHAQEIGVLERCHFLHCSAEALSLASERVDVVTVCSALIHMTNKKLAIAEFYRVLKPNGRLSLFEVINRSYYPEPPDVFWGYRVDPLDDAARKLKRMYEAAIPPDSDPMVDFDERILLELSEHVGFTDMRLNLTLRTRTPVQPRDWDEFLGTAWNPRAPTLRDAINESLQPAEARRFMDHLRPLVEAGRGTRRSAVAYLAARKA